MADLELTGEPVPDSNEGFITAADAAKLLGVSPSTVRRWASAGELGSRRDGRMLLICEEDVLARSQAPTKTKPKPAQATLDLLAEEAAAPRADEHDALTALEDERQARQLAEEKVRALSRKVAELQERVDALERQRQPWWAFWRL